MKTLYNKKEKNESIDGIRTLCIMEKAEFSAGGDSISCASHADNKKVFKTTPDF